MYDITSLACSAVAVFPVPIAQIGSYAITTFAKSSLVTSFNPANI